MAVPIEPFAYYKDLGNDHEITAWAAHTIHGPIDFFDALGWAPWNGTPPFYLSSYVCDLVSVPISLVVGNAWLAIKIVQVLQVGVAALGAAAMYATTRRSRFWAASFGFLYAALPATELAIRGNMELGWIAALMPGTFALGKIAVRRFGLRAIPFVGVVCGLTGGVIAIEYLIFVSLPLFALIVLPERRRATWARWSAYVTLGAGCCCTVGAFFLFPTFMHPLFTDAASRTVTLATGAFLDNFSESWIGLFTLVPRESLVSPTVEFNGTSTLPTLYPAAFLWWTCAIAFLVTTRTSRTSSDPASLVVIAGCAVLALGTALPFGRVLWDAVYLVPHLDAIRTTDRFLAIPALFVSFWFVLELQTLAERFHRLRAALGFGALAATLAAVAYARSQHCFSVDPSIGARLPQYDAVASTVAAIGGRTASFAGVNGGSSNDVPDYGLPQPISAAYLDLGGRFFEDGLGAAGMLGRLGVRSVVTSPNWTYDTPDVPPSSNVYRHVAVARTAFTSPEDVRVARIPSRAPVSPVALACTYGGPEGFDAAHLSAEAGEFAFAEPGATCDRTAYVDFDPRDAWRDLHPIDAWSAANLLPGSSRRRDEDYPYLPNRVLLDVPWYRNSIEGERPVFDASGTIRIPDGSTVVIPSHAAWPATATVDVRFASHRTGSLALTIDGRSIVRSFVKSYGFRWVSFALNHAVPANAAVRFTIVPGDADAEASEPVTFDGIVVLRGDPHVSPGPRPSLYLASIRRFDRDDRAAVSPTPFRLSSVVAMRAMHADRVGGDDAIVADAADSAAAYRWTGPPGAYEVAASAALPTGGASVSIATGRDSSGIDSSSVSTSDATAYARATLHTGSLVDVRIESPHFDPTSADRIVRVTAVRRSPVVVSDVPASGEVDFSSPLLALARLSDVRAIDITPEGAAGNPGSSLAFRISSIWPTAGLELAIERSGAGTGTMSLACGNRSIIRTLSTDFRTVAFDGGRATTCVGKIAWTAGAFTVGRIIVRPRASVATRRSARIWTAAGTYALTSMDDRGRPIETRAVRMDGCVGRRCSFARDGYRGVHVDVPLGASGTLELRRIERSPVAPFSLRIDGAERWTVRLRSRTDLELTELFDGGWHAIGEGRTYPGERCDITDTCFPSVPPGTYRIVHAWSGPLQAGIAITLATILGALFFMVLPIPRRGAAASLRK